MVIYLITNLINDKKYVGQTKTTIQKRFSRHCWKSETRKNMPITLAIQKYGKVNFKIEIICNCNSKSELDEKETYYAHYFNSFAPNGYNLKAGNGPNNMSLETREKIRIAHIGKKVSEITRYRLSESHKGYKVLESTKQKLSKLNKGKIPPKHVKDANIKKLEKLYFIINPMGEILIIKNMKNFCIANNLTPSGMCKLCQGKRKSHKGYKLFTGILDFSI